MDSSNSNIKKETRFSTQISDSVQSSSNMGIFSKIDSSVNGKFHVDENSNNTNDNNQKTLFESIMEQQINEDDEENHTHSYINRN